MPSAEPIWIFTSSAVRSPIMRLYRLRTKFAIASSSLLPAARTLRETTMPPSEITAISAVPPPMSMMRLPLGPEIGMFAPIAAASGSSIRCAARAPARIAASFTARRSTLVTPDGTQIMSSGRKMRMLPQTLSMKCLSMCSVMT